MEDNIIPPLTHDLNPGLCLPVTVEPVGLSNESDTTRDRYTFGQRPIEFGTDNCATYHV